MVAVHGGRGGVVGHANGRQLRVVRLEEADARAVHADAARDEVGGEREGVAVTGFNAGDLAAAFEAGEELFEFALAVAAQAEAGAQFGGVLRRVIGPLEQV